MKRFTAIAILAASLFGACTAPPPGQPCPETLEGMEYEAGWWWDRGHSVAYAPTEDSDATIVLCDDSTTHTFDTIAD